MKTNPVTATNEGQGSKSIPVRFAAEAAVRITVRQQAPALAWVPRKPSLLAKLDRPANGAFALLIGLFLLAGRPTAKAVLANAATDLAVVMSATAEDAALPAIRQTHYSQRPCGARP